MLASVAFATGLLCATVILLGFAATVLRADYRFWPPGSDERKQRLYLVCSRGSLLSVLATGVLDAGSLALPLWARVAAGVGAVLALVLLARAAADLGEDETRGRVVELRTDGLYRYTRNPQNLGYLVFFWAVAVAAASTLVVVFAGVITVWIVTQSVIEEPWLRDHYDGYAEYASRVPRFVGIRSLRRVASAIRSSEADANS